MNRSGKINTVDASFFGLEEVSRAFDFTSNSFNEFVKLSTSKYGIVKQISNVGGSDIITSFRMIYDTAKAKVVFSHNSMAIDSYGNLITVNSGDVLQLNDSLKTGSVYKVGIKYATTNKEYGLVKLLSIDGKTAEMSWDILGDQPVFSETLRGGSRYPVKISFVKENGTLLNTGSFTVINVDSTNNKATIVSDGTLYTENGLNFKVIGTHEPSYDSGSFYLYTYDSIEFYVGETLPSDYMVVGEVKFDTVTGLWTVYRDINAMGSSVSYFSLKNISPYQYNSDDFSIINDNILVKNKLNVRSDLTTSAITATTIGAKGDVSFDETDIRFCVNQNSWKKITLSSF